MGAGRLCLRARRFARRRALAGLSSTSWSRARVAGPLRLRRVGGTQAWSNGKVGINGISYYAMNQWTVGALRPPHLAAMCIWEGSSDYYRELCRHGGILCDFLRDWYATPGRERAARRRRARTEKRRHRRTRRPDRRRSRTANSRAIAPTRRRAEAPRELFDDYYRKRIADFGKIDVPLFRRPTGAAMGLHLRGNFEGFLRAGSKKKWLEVHGDTHFTHFYSDYGVGTAEALPRPFPQGRGYRLGQAAARALNIRRPGEKFVLRAENEWPLARTQWTQVSTSTRTACALDRGAVEQHAVLDLRDRRATASPSRCRRCDEPLEITGPLGGEAVGLIRDDRRRSHSRAAHVRSRGQGSHLLRRQRSAHAGSAWAGCAPRIASSIPRSRCLTGRGTRMTRSSRSNPASRSSSTWRSGRPRIVVPPGYRLALNIRGSDYEVDGTDIALPNAPYPMKGSGPFLHMDPDDRPAAVFNCRNALHFAAGKQPYLLLPVIPGR